MKKKMIYLVLMLIIIGLVYYFAFDRENKSDLLNTAEIKYQNTPMYQDITGFELTEYSSGNRKIKIEADRAVIKPKKIAFFRTPLIKEAHMSNPSISIYKDNRLYSKINSPVGKIDLSNKKIYLKDGVKLVVAGKKELSAKEMVLDPETGILSVGKRFILKENGKVIEGRGLKSDLELKDKSFY
jgi:LPS export ABC transporter protein LptC